MTLDTVILKLLSKRIELNTLKEIDFKELVYV
jgi:hypothetical protein